MAPLVKKWTRRLAVFAALAAGTCAVYAGGGGYGGGGYGGGGYGGGGFGGGFGGRGGGINIEQAILAREQQNVIAPDEEWAIIQPKLWRVVALQAMESPTPPNFAATAVRRIYAQNPGQLQLDPAIAALATENMKNENDLVTLLNDPNTPDNLIEIKLREYRTTRAKVRDALKAAEADLQHILTLRQETVLLTDGFMD